MEDNFDKNEFEEFLQDQVRNYRMYPTDTVWRDINKKLHGEKKWPALTIAAFTLLSATIAICVYFTPQPDIFNVNFADTEQQSSTLVGSPHSIILDNLASPKPYIDEKETLHTPPNNGLVATGHSSINNGKIKAASPVPGKQSTDK